DPYKEAAQQLLEQAPRSPEYVPDPIEMEDHVPLHIPEHPEDLVPAEDEATIEAYILEADTPPQKRLLLTASKFGCEVGECSAATVARQPGPTMAPYYQVDVRSKESLEFYLRHHDAQEDRATVRAKIEARVAVLETQACRHEWQHQTADDFAVQHIMRTQALEAGACIDTLDDTGSSS
nr:hypothetical protein [Tanacetum cinerariifolium]